MPTDSASAWHVAGEVKESVLRVPTPRLHAKVARARTALADAGAAVRGSKFRRRGQSPEANRGVKRNLDVDKYISNAPARMAALRARVTLRISEQGA